MIPINEIHKLAKLAKIKLNEQELKSFPEELLSIMAMIDRLQEVDVSNVEPLTSVCNIVPRMREDIAEIQDISQQLFLNVEGKSAQLAKAIKCFIVPKMVD